MNYPCQTTRYTQAVGAAPTGSYWSGKPPEQLTYPNQAGSPYLPQFGQDDPEPTARLAKEGTGFGYKPSPSPVWVTVGKVGSLSGVVLGAYHGYKRNNSVGWAIGWALLGGMFWPFVIPVAFAQGIGKRKRG